MIVVIEAGATHTKVCAIVDQEIGNVNLYPGINPNYMLDDAIHSILKEILGQLAKDTKVFYYGTGCAKEKIQERLKRLISEQYGLNEVSVYSDLLASARASAKSNSGQVNILGTGSASCIYDGIRITQIIPNNGYLFGDHGSGYKLGLSLLQAYFDNKLDMETQTGIEAYSDKNKEELLNHIYKGDSKAKISTFAKCAHQLKHHPAVNELIRNEFNAFIVKQIMMNPDYHTIDQYFTGSIASYFESELANCLQKHDLNVKKICKSPIEELCAIHLAYRQ